MWLIVRTGEQQGQHLSVADDEFFLGRGEECQLVIPDGKVSRRHARLRTLPGGAAELHDLGSSNGTFVNGERIETATLVGGEQVQLGDTILVASLEEPPRQSGHTVLGSAIFRRADSAVHRLRVQRGLRRATALGAAAVVTAVVSAILLATRVFFGDDASAAVKRVVREAAPGTVLVVAQDGSREVGSGSGWVIDAKEGLIVTNAHVLNGGNTFRIGLANEFRDARVVGVAPCEDLGLLRVRDTSGLKALPLGSQSSLELGETVIAVGYPGNASGEASLTSTTGVVSVVESAYRESALDVPRYSNVIQTDAAINPGNSGGPLLDLDGRLVGVNSAGRTIARDGRIVQGQNYAIGVDRVKEVTRILRTGRSLGWSGFSFDYPSAAELRRSKRPVGLRINEAVQGTEAARAGLSTKDATLLAVNGFSLDNSLASYCDAVDGIASGEQVRLTVLDRGARKAREITVALE